METRKLMATVAPLQGWRPRSEITWQVAAVPYDVVNAAQARALVAKNPWSFLHITKPEVDMPPFATPEAMYSQGAKTWRQWKDQGIFQRDPRPSYYVYGLDQGAHHQVGMVLGASVDDYENHIIRKHELTWPAKETDRFLHMQALQIQSGKVLLVYRDDAEVAQILDDVTGMKPVADFWATDGIRHRLWVVPRFLQDDVTQAFKKVGPLYIADGHHRAAAAVRWARTKPRTQALGQEPWTRFLAAAFPIGSMRIAGYHRVVHGLDRYDPEGFLKALKNIFKITLGYRDRLTHGCWNMYLKDTWYTIHWNKDIPKKTLLSNLDASLLQEHVLDPLLNIKHPRENPRLVCIGGSYPKDILEREVQTHTDVAFMLPSPSYQDIFSVADAGCTMPPKSTWFELKLRDGLVIHEV